MDDMAKAVYAFYEQYAPVGLGMSFEEAAAEQGFDSARDFVDDYMERNSVSDEGDFVYNDVDGTLNLDYLVSYNVLLLGDELSFIEVTSGDDFIFSEDLFPITFER